MGKPLRREVAAFHLQPLGLGHHVSASLQVSVLSPCVSAVHTVPQWPPSTDWLSSPFRPRAQSLFVQILKRGIQFPGRLPAEVAFESSILL